MGILFNATAVHAADYKASGPYLSLNVVLAVGMGKCLTTKLKGDFITVTTGIFLTRCNANIRN